MIAPGGDAALLRIPGSDKGVAVCVDCNPVQVGADPLHGSEAVVAETLRNLACVGAEPIGASDCLNFGNPEKPEVMRQFSDSVDGISRGMLATDCPIVSGNVSFYNETDGTDILPTPMLAVVGLAPRADVSCRSGFAHAGDRIALVGNRGHGHLGASEYLRLLHGREEGGPAIVDWDAEVAAAALVRSLVIDNVLQSAHDCAEGGIGLAVAESVVFGGRHGARLGASITLAGDEGSDPEHLLFGEEPGRYIVSVGPQDADTLQERAQAAAVPLSWLGVVGGNHLKITVGSRQVELPVAELSTLWESGFEQALGLNK